MKTFKQFLTEEKEQLEESLLPKELSLALSFEKTGYDYLDDNYEQSYFNVSSDMIRVMIKNIKSQSDADWMYNSGVDSEKEAAEEKKYLIKTLEVWLKSKTKEEDLLKEMESIINLEDGYFDHDGFVNLIKVYLKDFSK